MFFFSYFFSLKIFFFIFKYLEVSGLVLKCIINITRNSFLEQQANMLTAQVSRQNVLCGEDTGRLDQTSAPVIAFSNRDVCRHSSESQSLYKGNAECLSVVEYVGMVFVCILLCKYIFFFMKYGVMSINLEYEKCYSNHLGYIQKQRC